MTSDSTASVTSSEWRKVAVWSAVILTLTSLPVVLGYAMSNDAYVFTGAAHHPEDVMSYLAKMRQGYEGSWAIRLPFTTEDHPGIPLFYLFYSTLGHIGRWTGISLPVLYHGARVMCAAFLLWTTYRFIAFVLPHPTWRWTAFLLATVGSGFGGWAILITGSFAPGGMVPIDLWPLDFYTFALLLLSPHQTLGVALLLVIVQNVAAYWQTGSTRLLIGAAAAALAEGFIFPFMPMVYGVTLAAAWLWERQWRASAWKTLGPVALVVAIPMPIAIHYWLSMQQHPVWVSFTSQNLTLSPAFWHYALGYGLVGILALPGGWWAWRSGRPGRLAVILVLASLVLAYLPVNFQRRLIIGAHLPMCALAAAGIHGWLVPLWNTWRPASGSRQTYREGLTQASLVGFSAVSSLYVLLGIFISILAYFPGLYITADTSAGIRWLAAETPSDAAVLSAFDTGMVIPAFAGRKVFWGHSIETPFLSQKQDDANHFFSAATPDADRLEMIERYGITHLFYGPDERSLGDFDPKGAPYLKAVYRHNTVAIYQIILPPRK